jgi:hypothetical protein
MNEKKILAALVQDRKNYDRVEPYLDANDFGPEAKLILETIRDYYETDTGAKNTDIEILAARLERRLPNPKHAAS